MICCEQLAHGIALHVKVHAGARKNSITGEHGGALKISVAQVPEKGKANNALIALLASWLGISKSQIQLLSGETSSQKRFLIREIDMQTLQSRLRQHMK
jgi:uncharacterized protein (TIGR00251 family)